MRFYEFSHNPSSTPTLDDIVLLLNALVGKAEDDGVPANFDWDTVRGMTQTIGQGHLGNYNVFRQTIRKNPALQDRIANYSREGIKLKVPGVTDPDDGDDDSEQTPQDTVDQIASGAAEKQMTQRRETPNV